MSTSGIMASFRDDESGGAVLYLIPQDEASLSELIHFFPRKEEGGQERMITIDDHPDGPKAIIQIVIRTIPPSEPERISVVSEIRGARKVIWEGAPEYWEEVIDKCSYLLDAGFGHQHLMVRGSSKQDVVLSLREGIHISVSQGAS